jgi:hypothetical protein
VKSASGTVAEKLVASIDHDEYRALNDDRSGMPSLL